MMLARFAALGMFAALWSPADLASQRKVRAIGGRVLDGEDQPVVGARIVLRWRAHPELPSLIGYTLGDAGQEEKEFTSGKKGRFRIVPPHRGPFMLVAFHGETSSTQVFPVLPGDFHTLKLEPNHYMRGWVQDATARPIAGAEVRIVPTDNLQRIRLGLYNQPERRAVATTDERGHFQLLFEHGYLRDPRWNVLMALQAEKDGVISGALEHQRPTRDSTMVRLTLTGKRSFSARVIDRTTSRPIAGVRLLDPLHTGNVVLTDAKGTVQAPAQRGEKVMLIAKGYEPSTITLGTTKAKKFQWSMAPGLKLKTKLSGPEGPLSGARILLAIPQGNAYPIEWLDAVGKDGAVAIDSVPKNQLVMMFVEVDGRFVKFLEGNFAAHSELPPILVNPERVVRGRVVDASKMPVAGARVALQSMLIPNNPRRVTYTDRAGRFEFDGVYPFRHQVIAAKGEHGQRAVTIALADLEKPMTITLAPKQTIEGQVVGPDGKPAAGAWVSVYRSVNGPVMRGPRTTNTCLGTMADDKGRFRFGVPANSRWTVIAALLRDGAHYNHSTSVAAGRKDIVLRVTVQNN